MEAPARAKRDRNGDQYPRAAERSEAETVVNIPDRSRGRPAPSSQLSALSSQLSALSFQIPAPSSQLSALSSQLPDSLPISTRQRNAKENGAQCYVDCSARAVLREVPALDPEVCTLTENLKSERSTIRKAAGSSESG